MTPLEELAAKVNALHAGIVASSKKTVFSIMDAGDILLQIQAELDVTRSFTRWLETEFCSTAATGFRYMRFARHRAEITQGINDGAIVAGPGGVLQAAVDDFLRSLPVVMDERDAREEDTTTARLLFLDGVPRPEIERILGRSSGAVRAWTKDIEPPNRRWPERTTRAEIDAAKRRAARGRAARQALMQQERERAAKKAAKGAGGSVAKVYSLVRQTGQELDRACAESTDFDVRGELTAALAELHKVEDRIVRALGVE